MGKKVLVRSRFREVTVRTRREWKKDEKGNFQEILTGFRQFYNHLCYMTPSEAATLIDSPENRKHLDHGLPALYAYPAGMPVPVDEEHEGPLAPPMSSEGLVANNPQQNEAARIVHAAAEASILAREADAKNTAALAQGPAEIPRAGAPVKIGAKPMKIHNPDLGASDDALAGTPEFRDTKAAVA